mmetsp:Transcript_32053/g.70455  ORF Transcript_32053/g.70455 Transcript_32053/m.70455 type:complete len:122 (-) Transcript_32053:3213-3578(-)
MIPLNKYVAEQLKAPPYRKATEDTDGVNYEASTDGLRYELTMDPMQDPARTVPTYHAGEKAEHHHNGTSTQVATHCKDGRVCYEILFCGAGTIAVETEKKLDLNLFPKGQPALLNPHTTSA